MTRSTRRRLIALVAAIVMSLGTAGSALAAWTALVSGTGSAAAGTMPAGPTPSAVFNGTDTTVSWTAAELAGGATPSYIVKRYAGTTPSTPNTGCDSATTALQCTESATPEGQWTYTVTVAKGSWRGAASATSLEVHVPTFTPTNLTAGTTTRTSVGLSWTDNSQIETGYRIQRLVGDDWQTMGSDLPAGTTSGSDWTITCSETRRYRVLALNETNGNSAPSDEIEATASACPLAEAQPTGLTATAVSTTQIILAWTDNATAETGYRVESSPDGALWSTRATIAANSTSYQDTTLTCGETRHYRVIALGEVDSNYSDTATATAEVCPGPPAAPSDLAGVGVSPTTISLSWTDNSNNETKFVLERSNNSQFNAGGNVQSFDIAANATAFDDTAAATACDTTRHYRLRAVNANGESVYVSATAKTLECPPATPSITVTTNVHTLTVGWSAVSGATGYKVERLNPTTSLWEQIATTTTTSHADVLSCGQTRNYRVRATNAGGDSGYSNQAPGTTQVCAPTGAATLSASVTGHTANLSWTAVTDASGYKVERQNGATWDLVSTTSTRTYSESIACGQSRTYRVRAYNGGGDSATNSNTVSPMSGVCPKALSVALANGSGGTVGQISNGDTVTVTYEALPNMAPTSFCSSWTGSTFAIDGGNHATVTVTDTGTNDTLTVTSTQCGTNNFQFGSVALGGNYVTSTATFGANNPSSNRSTITWDPATKALTIRVGNRINGTVTSNVPEAAATYAADADLRDADNNPIDTKPVSTTSQRF